MRFILDGWDKWWREKMKEGILERWTRDLYRFYGTWDDHQRSRKSIVKIATDHMLYDVIYVIS